MSNFIYASICGKISFIIYTQNFIFITRDNARARARVSLSCRKYLSKVRIIFIKYTHICIASQYFGHFSAISYFSLVVSEQRITFKRCSTKRKYLAKARRKTLSRRSTDGYTIGTLTIQGDVSRLREWRRDVRKGIRLSLTDYRLLV